ncbi:hypothetical protein [Aliiroseovarius sp. F47248L]|uniref:hypothetical protein n=1 Tax=Aliiroseovarius sp. F47248L TaxID=2926420 RepID=UPI001FF6F16C|nr:hypothetical protein [Aliiroseovarius sp. F47248L]MCK0138041.1 hypothetical protein [Aliiroseovarius sp. F47248L]
MSDPVSNAEIEDVLSSIRRLISESKATDGRADQGKAEKLVLTPAFRVHDEGSAKSASPKPDRNPVQEQPASLDAIQQNKSTGGAKANEEEQPVPVFSHRGYTSTPDEEAEEFHDLSESSNDAAPSTGSVSEIEEVVSQRDDMWEADGGDETNQTDVLMFHAARLKTEDEYTIVGETGQDDWSDKSTGDVTDEAPFIAVADPEDVAPAPPARIVQNHPERMTSVPTGREVEIVGDDTDIIDEEVVQAMVARLVREELQGEVGEKITQSIRRFVRREIERALTLKGLE